MAEQKKHKPEQKKASNSGNSSILINVFIILFLVAAVSVAVMLMNGVIKFDFYKSTDKTEKKDSSTAAIDTTNLPPEIDYTIKSSSEIADEATSNSAQISPSTKSKNWRTPGSPDGKFHVIAGVFYNKMLLQKQKQKFEQLGLSVTILEFTSEGGNVFYRISLDASSSLSEAESKRDELMGQGISTWILKP